MGGAILRGRRSGAISDSDLVRSAELGARGATLGASLVLGKHCNVEGQDSLRHSPPPRVAAKAADAEEATAEVAAAAAAAEAAA